MFNILKPKITIEQIHNDFDLAQERLLQQAKEIISQFDVTPKAERLKRIGFVNSKTVTGNAIVVRSRQEAELIEYYKQQYPFLKFLTETELNRLCKKYNLIHAPISNYIEDVPEKNIAEIEAAQELRYADIPKDTTIISISCNISGLTKDEVKQVRSGIEIEDRFVWNNSAILTTHFGKEVTCEYNTIGRKEISVNKQGLFIAAPKSHFNKEGLTKASKFGFFNVTINEVKDPIVFRYCRGGVQVLTKWGLEASDESLVNEKMN